MHRDKTVHEESRVYALYQVRGYKLIFKFKKKIIYLFLAALGLRCCVRAFSSCVQWGLLFAAVHGFLTPVASLVAEHGL